MNRPPVDFISKLAIIMSGGKIFIENFFLKRLIWRSFQQQFVCQVQFQT